MRDVVVDILFGDLKEDKVMCYDGVSLDGYLVYIFRYVVKELFNEDVEEVIY